MCGIAGLLKCNEPTTPEDVAAVQRMVDAQVHRGPDDQGIAALPPPCLPPHGSRPSIVLGHRRLSIIDLSEAGRQPMPNEDGTVWVTYNGEIYNFHELHKELIDRGHRFISRTDTEALVHGYEEWGIHGLLGRLRGMFAFGIWDEHKQCLCVARDRLGKKPAYYLWDGRQFLFASEIKALLASGLVERRLNPAAVVAYFALGSVPAPLTMIAGVEALPPGGYLMVQNGTLDLKRYWHLSFDEDPSLTEAECIDRLRTVLQEAVRLRLVSDVPVGAFLSGGIDSSAIVALMREATGGTIRTFSMVFREQEFNEGAFAKVVAQRFGTEHTQYEVTSGEVLKELPRIIWAMDQPTIDGVNTYFVSKATREAGTIVALSGLGGDELFGGYPSFQLVPRLYHASKVAHAMPGCRWALERILPLIGHNGRTHKLRALFRSPPSPEMAYLAVRGLFLDEELKAILNTDLLDETLGQFMPLRYLEELRASDNASGCRNMVSLLELRTYMHNQLLRDTDVMSMAHSLEVRTPFLDHRLVEVVANVPAKHKFTAKPKGLLLKALGDELPHEVTERPKGTFTFPFERWLTAEWREMTEENLRLMTYPDMFNHTHLMSLWVRFLRGQIHWSRIWAVVVLVLWLHSYACSWTSSK